MEIGSEYNLYLNNLSIKKDNIFDYLSSYNCLYVDSGRSALKLLPKVKGKILLPEYLCDSVYESFDKNNILLYTLHDDLTININNVIDLVNSNEISYIFIMHYFGSIQPINILKQIRDIASKRNILIVEDFTHSLLSTTRTIGDYMIASLRKWFPIANGGVIYSKLELSYPNGITKTNDNSRTYGFILKSLFLNNVIECNNLYRMIFKESEKKLDSAEHKICKMSDLSKFICSCFSIGEIRKARRQNYNYLCKTLSDINIHPLILCKDNECPFAYVLRSENRDELREKLNKKFIYCAVHWPLSTFCKNSKLSKSLSEQLLSISIDNRYSKEYMDYIYKVLKGEI